MGFGFVVVKFSIFLKEVSLAINLPRPELVRPSVNSHIVGILLVSLGAVIIVFSYLRYRDTDSAIENGNDDNPKILIKLLAVVLFFIGIILLIYLLLST
ncbi:hypothetical protein GCM10023149_16350 [Mucilaginibacter gynuensis]|uniref:DUF202 domain-containing protein n=2 Tax=Mucilaginibacter gynuensis TaxID=1302236 RepID=A0ABP8G6W9_9SPHI